jgi:hypothetical protein
MQLHFTHPHQNIISTQKNGQDTLKKKTSRFFVTYCVLNTRQFCAMIT